MNFIQKLIPAFLARFDKKLLLNHPTWWVMKLHYLLFWQLALTLASWLICFAIPQRLGSYPDVFSITFIITVINILLVLLWLYEFNKFDIRTRNNPKPRLYEQIRIGSYVLALALVFINIAGCNYLLHYQTTQVAAPVNAAAFDKINRKINYFERNQNDFARGFSIKYKYDSIMQKSVKYRVDIPMDSIQYYCEEIGRLNGIYGDGTTYSRTEIYAKLIDTVGFYNSGNPYTVLPSSNCEHLSQLFYNSDKLERSFRFTSDFCQKILRELHGYLLIVAIIVSIMILLITFFKYFGIYQIITGLISPGLTIVIGFFILFLMAQSSGGSDHYLLDVTMVCSFIAIVALLLVGHTVDYSNKRLVFLFQSLSVFIPAFLFPFYFEIIDNSVKCYQYLEPEIYPSADRVLNPDYFDCLDRKRLVETGGAYLLILGHLFLLLPAYLKILYRQYYLPEQK
ncbi:hypothetical protein GC194_03655 [bacterium]|nr:hypothetical protein [bacterium]